jgi:heavy metal sensor kinase
MKSFRSKLVLGFTLLTAAVTGLVCAWVYQTTAEALRIDIDRLVRDRAFVLARAATGESPRLQPWMEAFLETDRLGVLTQVVAVDGSVVSQSANLPAPLPFTEAAKGAAATSVSAFTETVKGGDGAAVRLATVPMTIYRDGKNVVLGYAQAGLPEAKRDSRLMALQSGLIATVLASAIVAWILAALLVQNWLRTVDAAAQSARRIGAGHQLRERLFVPSNEDDLARLARAFNELLDHLESAHITQQQFLADASHELRTPLTVLRGEIEVALRRDRSAAEYREVLESSREEIERLSRLTENLLALARSDAGEGLASREPVELVALCEKVSQSLAARATAAQVSLVVQSVDPVWVRGDPLALERVCWNLADNALRYSPAGESVTIRVTRDGETALLSVEDVGLGISEEHLPHVYDRFFRVDKARAREQGGAGLGLAIVKALVTGHGGEVSVSSAVGKGTTFTVRLPSAPAPDL